MKNKLKAIKKGFNDTSSIQKKDWVIFGIVAFFLFFCFAYWDIFVTTTHTVNFIEVISKGNFMDFYKVNYQLVVDGFYANVCYDLPIYFILMIWDFPLWIIQHFFKVNIITNFACILWMKSILLVFLVLSSIVIKKILQELGVKSSDSKWASFLFLSSPLVFLAIYITCQIDIIPIFFVLLGILAYIKNDEKKFIMWFCLAIPMKLLPLFIFIPLLLMKEKNIFKIGYKFIIANLLLLVSKLVAFLMPYYFLSTTDFNNSMLIKLFTMPFSNINLSPISLFLLFYAYICGFCFVKKFDKKELNKYVIYIPLLVFIIFFAFVDFHPYWTIYLTPFIAMMLFINKKNYKLSFLVSVIYELCISLLISYQFPWCFGGSQSRFMLISTIFGEKMEFLTIRMLIENLNLVFVWKLIYGIFLATSIWMAIVNYPVESKESEKIKVERISIWLRMLIPFLIGIVLVICYILST